jgi:hypothetical protein
MDAAPYACDTLHPDARFPSPFPTLHAAPNTDWRLESAPHGDQRLDLRCFALFDVALAQIPVIQSTYSSTHRTNAIQADFNDPERVAHYAQQVPPAFAPGHAGMLQMAGVLLAERTPETGHQRTVR